MAIPTITDDRAKVAAFTGRSADNDGNIIVDNADAAVCQDSRVALVTYSMGSCMAVSIWDPVAKVVGLLRYMFHDSSVAPEEAERNPAMFCDTGVPRLFSAAYGLGAEKRRLIVKVAGGSRLIANNKTFDIGLRNYLALRKIFWKNGVTIAAENVGGAVRRTMLVRASDGAVALKIRGKEAAL